MSPMISATAAARPAPSQVWTELLKNCRCRKSTGSVSIGRWRLSRMERPMITDRALRRPGGIRRQAFAGVRRAAPDHGERAVTGVAVPALPVGRHVLAEVIEYEPRSTLRALTVGNHGAELGAVLQPALLVIREVGAQIHRRQSTLETLPTSAAILPNEPMSLEQHEHDAGLSARDPRLIGEVVEDHRLAQRNALEHDRHAGCFFDVGVF